MHEIVFLQLCFNDEKRNGLKGPLLYWEVFLFSLWLYVDIMLTLLFPVGIAIIACAIVFFPVGNTMMKQIVLFYFF